MAKKKAAKAARPVARPAASPQREPRKEPYSLSRFGLVTERLKELTARIDAIGKAIKESKLDAVDVDGHAMLVRAFTQIENFADNAARSVREARNAARRI
jgi:hypothetical protein